MRSRFTDLHPAVLFLYFAVVLVTVAFASHPLMQGLCLLGAFAFCILTEPGYFFRTLWRYLLPVLLLALSNPFFSHSGVTPLFYINDTPFTLEAVLYGVNLGVMLMNMLYWFRVLSRVMTGDRMLGLFGGFLPKITMLLTVAVRFVPRLRKRIVQTREAQQALGSYRSDRYTDRLRFELKIFSSVLMGSLENAIDTGDAMRARGYGLSGRTSFRQARLGVSGIGALAGLILLTGVIYIGLLRGGLEMTFYPRIVWHGLNGWGLASASAFFVLCLIPAAAEIRENIQWKYFISRI